MRQYFQHKHSCPSLKSTSTSFYPKRQVSTSQQSTHLTNVNYHLLNEITDVQTEKNYYRTRLTQQFHTHHGQLENLYTTVSQKNNYIIQLEEQLDRMSKDFRVLSDDYVGLKNQTLNQKELYQTEIRVLKINCQQKIKQCEDESMARVEIMINKRVEEVESQCEKRVDMFKTQLQEARANSTQLSHQLKLLQQDYHQVMIKNETIIQQSIHRELRKRDFQLQNNYLRDVAQYEHMKTINQQLKNDMEKGTEQVVTLQKQNKRLKAQNIIMQTKLKDIEQAFIHEKQNNRTTLSQKYKSTDEVQTNTDQQFVPVILPVETNLVGEIIALKQFLTEKMIIKYEEFFTKASLKEKKKSASLITFKNYLNQQLKNSKQNTLLMHIHTGMERIVKLYCPAMNYSRQYLTVKDQFIRKTLMECQTLANKQQKLFRLLELVHRLHHPITHVKAEISTGELRMVEIKVMATLKKIFSSA